MADRPVLLNNVPAPRPEPEGEQTPPAWWQLREWQVDRHVLARVRDGLEAMAPRSAAAAAPLTETGKPAAEPEATEPVATEPEAPEPEAPGPESDAASSSLLTGPAVDAIRSTFAIVAEAGDAVPGYFYGQLFARQPRLRAMFPAAMDAQRDRLVKALVRVVESLTTPEEMAAYLAQLGRDHRKYRVDPAMYEVVGAALLATLRRFAGTAFTPAAEQAWTDAFAAVSALMIQAADEAGATAPAFWPAEVVSVEERFPGMAVLTIALDQEMQFEAGQHITVQHPRWPRVWRPYSIASCPREDGLVQLHVKAIPGGWVSNALVRHTAPGSQLILGPPLGTMTLAAAAGRDLVCVAGGTGLAPIKAIVAQAVRDAVRDSAQDPAARARRIDLFCGARQRAELYDLTDLWQLADAWPGLQIIPVTSDDRAFEGVQGNVGRVAARYLPHRRCEAYVAGPPAMVGETIRVLAEAGLPRERIHFDDALLAGSGDAVRPGPPPELPGSPADPGSPP
jgi:NAD(P)H-flavin reductase